MQSPTIKKLILAVDYVAEHKGVRVTAQQTNFHNRNDLLSINTNDFCKLSSAQQDSFLDGLQNTLKPIDFITTVIKAIKEGK